MLELIDTLLREPAFVDTLNPLLELSPTYVFVSCKLSIERFPPTSAVTDLPITLEPLIWVSFPDVIVTASEPTTVVPVCVVTFVLLFCFAALALASKPSIPPPATLILAPTDQPLLLVFSSFSLVFVAACKDTSLEATSLTVLPEIVSPTALIFPLIESELLASMIISPLLSIEPPSNVFAS